MENIIGILQEQYNKLKNKFHKVEAELIFIITIAQVQSNDKSGIRCGLTKRTRMYYSCVVLSNNHVRKQYLQLSNRHKALVEITSAESIIK